MTKANKTLTLEEAIVVLRSGGALVDVAEAIGVVISSSESRLDDILLGLSHGGFVAEQAAMALHHRTGRPLVGVKKSLVRDAEDWSQWLSKQMLVAAKVR